MFFIHILTFSAFCVIISSTSLPNSQSSYSGEQIKPFVVGGEPAHPHEFPFLVNIQEWTNEGKRALICAGSLIDWNVVLSAAHCLINNDTGNIVPLEQMVVVAGDYNILYPDKYEVNSTIADIRVHPKFAGDDDDMKNDIALLKLAKSFEHSKMIDLIQLPTKNLDYSTTLVVAGWGATESKNYSEILLKAEIPLQDNHLCNISDSDKDRQICAGGDGKDSCKGDSGGALMCKVDTETFVCGIVSYGPTECGKSPGLYTNVFGYLAWINENRHFPPPTDDKDDGGPNLIIIGIFGFLAIIVAIVSVGIYEFCNNPKSPYNSQQ